MVNVTGSTMSNISDLLSGVPGSIQSIERAAAVLRLLGAATGPVGLSEVARSLGLPKATASGIVSTLSAVGFVARDPRTGRYGLGEGLAKLRVGTDPHDLRSAAMNWTDQLAARTGLEVHLGVPSPAGVHLVHHVFRPDDSAQRLRTGQVQPLHATALGKVLLAYVPGSWPLPGAALERYTVRTCTDRVALAVEMDSVRGRGYAVDRGECTPDTAALAAPVRHHGGLVIGAVGVAGPYDRVVGPRGEPLRGLVEHTVTTARAVSTQLAEGR